MHHLPRTLPVSSPAFSWPLTFFCLQSNDDYTNGGPGSVVGTGAADFVYTVRDCGQCVQGMCDPADGCVCNQGWEGPTCDKKSAAVMTGVSAATFIVGAAAVAYNAF